MMPKIEIKEEEEFDQEVLKSSSFDVKPKLEQVEASESDEVKIKNDPSKETIRFVENIEFSDNTKREIKDEKGFDQKVCESPPFDVKAKLEQLKTSERNEVKIENDPFKEIVGFVENIEFSDNTIPKREIKDKKGFDQKICKSSPFDVKPKLEEVEAQIKNDPFRETIDFFDNIEFSDNIMPKNEIKDEEGRNQEVWKSQPFEQKEASETSQAEIGTEPEEFFSVDDTETLCTESFVSDNVAVDEKKNNFECSLCQRKFGLKHNLNMHIAVVHEKKKPFECSMCPSKFGQNVALKRHIAAVHEKKN